ncbi:MAG: hypothetical protein Q4C00_01700 [Bacillota bacterium]|nr:hypothetical protein [Bacillota bacterium]
MSKRLISVLDIKTLYEQGQKELCLDDDSIITPAAKDTAVEYGIKIQRGGIAPCTATVPAPTQVTPVIPAAPAVSMAQASPVSSGASPVVAAGSVVNRSQAVSPATKCPPVPGYREDNTLITSPWPELKPTPCSVATQPTPSAQTVPWPAANPVAFQAIAGGNTPQAPEPVVPAAPAVPASQCCSQGVDGDLVAQIVRQVMSQLNGGQCEAPSPQADLVRAIDPDTGFMLIKGNNIKMDVFNDGEKDRPGVFIKELTNPQESPNMTSGFMALDHADLTWTLTYDEMDYVIDGTLEFIVNGKKYTGLPGDVFYIPTNTTVTFTTPDTTKFFFVTYPANWAELCGAK